MIKENGGRWQQTIEHEAKFEGIALHAGDVVSVRLLPGEVDSGIIFRRTDVQADIRADCQRVADTHLATTLQQGEVSVSTVEHLLSALSALELDNIVVELVGSELPIVDGSAAPWLLLLTVCGAQQQSRRRRYIRVKRQVDIVVGRRRASLSPMQEKVCRYDVTIDYPHSVVNRTGTHYSFLLTSADYERQISKARTFCYLNDVEWMHQNNRAQGGSLQNAVVYDDNGIINKEGLRYPNEFVRHKILDVIGDLYINGHLVLGDYVGDSPGHDLNNQLMRALMEDTRAWEWSE